MTLRLVQLIAENGTRAVAVLAEDRSARLVAGAATTYALAQRAIAGGLSLQQAMDKAGLGDSVDIFAALAEGRVLAPLDHPSDPAHLIVSGTGPLTMVCRSTRSLGRRIVHSYRATGYLSWPNVYR